MREYLGLDEPLWQQYLVYLNNLLHGDFGTSVVNNQPVLDASSSSASRPRSS